MKLRIAVVILLLVVLMAVYLVGAQGIYTSHEDVVAAAVDNGLEQLDGQLPKDSADLTSLDLQNPVVTLYDVADWQVESVELRNRVSIWKIMLDDDPTYHLEADLRVRFEDGSSADLVWESWRYGVVMGPGVIGRGDGSPRMLLVASTPGGLN